MNKIKTSKSCLGSYCLSSLFYPLLCFISIRRGRDKEAGREGRSTDLDRKEIRRRKEEIQVMFYLVLDRQQPP